MTLVVITFLLMAMGAVAYFMGAWKLSRYASRISGGLGMAVLLLPPVTFWFAFFKLEEEGKEMPTTLWLYGIVTTILLTIVFFDPISMALTGRIDELDAPITSGATASVAPGTTDTATTPPTEEAPPTSEPAATATNNAGAAPDATATNNAAPATNNAAPASDNNETTGAEAPAAAP